MTNKEQNNKTNTPAENLLNINPLESVSEEEILKQLIISEEQKKQGKPVMPNLPFLI